jgi:hypothetical protein
MTLPISSSDRLLTVHLTLNQYPILANRIRFRMRRELFERGVVDPQAFEVEAREKAIQSQAREGLRNPYFDESTEVWERRLGQVRDQLTDFYFSEHLSYSLLHDLINEVLSERGVRQQDTPLSYNLLSINPELSSQELLFEQGMMIETQPPGERSKLEARLREIKVVLIRTLISDQLPYINIAKEWFKVSDLTDIRRRKIGPGRIGGKAAGMMLAGRILREAGDDALRHSLVMPESFFVGADLMYTFMANNNLVHWNDQKYKDEDEMRADYPLIQRDFESGEFPPEILEGLQYLLATIGKKPLIVRSSSLLEDNFGTSFAGKYESIFLPNQGTLKENLDALCRAIARVYATTLNPPALLYRRSRGLLDYDERMAILIQTVMGEPFGDYFLPHVAGVAFSRNQYRWAPQIRGEDGFVRMVWGLGTRAVDRVGNDYPRLVALSHPTLRPSSAARSIRRYSQQYVDLIDIKDNAVKTLPVQEVLKSSYEPLRFLAQLDQDGYFSSLRSNLVSPDEVKHLFLTLDDFLRRTPFAERMRTILHLLEKSYHSPVDMEFTAFVTGATSIKPEVRIAVLQCRPQSHLQDAKKVVLPTDLLPERVIISSRFMVPDGHVPGIRYILFVTPEGYFSIPTAEERFKLERIIGKLNVALAGKVFICVGPGRWGTSNPDLGVHVDYADIFNCRALVEIAGRGIGPDPEPSLGTHFFQDLLEGQIFPLAISLDDPQTVFNRAFFYDTPNHVSEWVQVDSPLLDCLRLIDVADYRPNHRLDLTMNDEKGQAIAYLVPEVQP